MKDTRMQEIWRDTYFNEKKSTPKEGKMYSKVEAIRIVLAALCVAVLLWIIATPEIATPVNLWLAEFDAANGRTTTNWFFGVAMLVFMFVVGGPVASFIARLLP